MEEIMSVSLPKTMKDRMKVIQNWLGDRYTTWKINNEIEAERETQYKELEKQQEEEKQFKDAKELYIEGKEINSEQFVLLCKKSNIAIPLKTHGWINKNLVYIKNDGSYGHSGIS